MPGAFGIDDSPDHSILYVGTQIGDLYLVDPVALVVTKRYRAADIGPNGFRTYTALALADGRLALLGGQGGLQSIDGFDEFGIWNPADNSLDVFTSAFGAAILGFLIPPGPPPPYKEVCGPLNNMGGFARTPDRKKIFVWSIDSDGTLCVVDPPTATFSYTKLSQYPVRPTFSPDGNYILVSDLTALDLLDGHDLSVIARFSPNGDTSSGSSFIFSPDSKTFFVSSANVVYAYDTSTRQQMGWLPNLFVPPTSGGSVSGPVTGPNFQAMDNTGLLFGPMEQGVGFLDTAAMQRGNLGTKFANGYVDPSVGPVAGGTSVSLVLGSPFTTKVNSVYFGAQSSSFAAVSNSLRMTAPAGTAGPADIRILAEDGGVIFIPEGFSYGPTILQVTPNVSTADGGGIGAIFGYGFGPTASNSIPPDLQVSVGRKAARVIGYDRNAYQTSSPPFLLEAISFVVPPGSAGIPADVVVTNTSGSATAHLGMAYIAAPTTYVRAGASLSQGIYDPHRDLYYFTDADRIQVLSTTNNQWLSAITLPAPAPGASQRLWGIGLSPDGTKLAISDRGANVIYVADPAGASGVKTFAIPSPPNGVLRSPAGLAISDDGMVYYAVSNLGASGSNSYFKLDTNTGQITDYNISGPSLGAYLRVSLSADGQRAYFNNEGAVFSINTATNKVSHAANGPSCCYGDFDLTLSSDQTRLAATGYLYDSSLRGESYLALNVREQFGISYLYGMKLSPDGRLLFQPYDGGIDVLDGHLGVLRNRVSLPLKLSDGFDSLVSNGQNNVLLAIVNSPETANAVAVLDLTSVAEPAPLPYSTSAAPSSVSATSHSVGRAAAESQKAPNAAPLPRLRTPPHASIR